MKKNFLRTLLIIGLSAGLSITAIASDPTDYFRSLISGEWKDASSWESSDDGITYFPADLAPTSVANTITISSGKTISLTDVRVVDQVVVNAGGILEIAAGSILKLNNGPGTDLNVQINGKLIFRSLIDKTATFGELPSGATILQNSNVTVERFIPSNRAFRLMTVPLRSATGTPVTIFSQWQNNGIYIPGVGTLVTAPTGTFAAQGIDANKDYSMKYSNGTTLVGLGSTKSTSFPLFGTAAAAANRAYFIFVRGDRDPNNLDTANSNNTILRATGQLQTGTQTFSANPGNNKIVMVGNPYACPVDFNLVTRTGYQNRFYAWDPNLNTDGAYVLVDDVDNNGLYSTTPQIPGNPTTAVSQFIQSGQAIALLTATAGNVSITFNENDKANVNNSLIFRNQDTDIEQIFSVNLMQVAGSETRLADGAAVVFSDKFFADVRGEDAPKLENFRENIALSRDNVDLILERRPAIKANDTLFINLWNVSAKTYQLKIAASNLEAGLYTATLEDAFLKKSSPLDLTGATEINFDVTNDPASFGKKRFMIVFKTSSVLPLTFTQVKAYQKSTQIQVEWNMGNENNIKSYEIEKSKDGVSFVKSGDVSPRIILNQNIAYTWLDVNAVSGNNLYRIKAVEKSGEVKYSQVVNVVLGKGDGVIKVYPNPVKNKNLSLQFNNQEKGVYAVQLFNSAGQEVFNARINHLGGSATQTVQLTHSIAKGSYQLQVAGDNSKMTQTIIIQ